MERKLNKARNLINYVTKNLFSLDDITSWTLTAFRKKDNFIIDRARRMIFTFQNDKRYSNFEEFL